MTDDILAHMPSKTSVVVIGGGIIGVMTALELAERNIPVVLCEKGAIAAEQSGRNLGWCRQLGRDERELPLSVDALARWKDLDKRIGAPTGFRQSGILSVYETQEELDQQADRIAALGPRAADLGMRLLTRQEVDARLPGSSKTWAGGVICETDGRAEPGMATLAIASAAERAGAILLTRCAVRGVERQAGTISAVITERGRIACDQVVLAGGVWSRHLCGAMGVKLPTLLAMESLLRTTPVADTSGPCLTTGKLAHRPRLDGGYTVASELGTVTDVIPATFRYMLKFLPAFMEERSRVHVRFGKAFFDEVRLPNRWKLDQVSPFERHRTLEAKPAKRWVNKAFAALQALYPQFQSARIAQYWGGFIDVTPDALPVLSDLEACPGLYLATGFSGHGFGLGPAIGAIVADQITGERAAFDLTAFAHDRFWKA